MELTCIGRVRQALWLKLLLTNIAILLDRKVICKYLKDMFPRGRKMKTMLVYFSRGGNTRKIAQAMAEELRIAAVDVKEAPNVTDADLLVVGSGTYGSKPGDAIVAYLENLKPVSGKKAACFSSCAGDATQTLAAMKEILGRKGYSIVDCFSCFGKFAVFSKRGHPSAEELSQAREFAKKLKTAA
jgi:flavodoxin